MNGLYLRRWMLFVDGENLTIQAQRLASAGRQGIAPDARHYRQDTFLWTPKLRPMRPLGADTWSLQPAGLRAYYYTSVVGNDETLQDVVRALRTLGFHPEVFQKPKGMKSKGVDVSLTKDVLSHAFYGNYEAAVLIAGDADYCPLVDEVQRLGKLVYLAFFVDAAGGLSEKLRLACDGFEPLDRHFTSMWRPQ